jgi:hypothetical protein
MPGFPHPVARLPTWVKDSHARRFQEILDGDYLAGSLK